MTTDESEHIDRFVSKTRKKPNGCIEWIGARHRNGYGKFQARGRQTGTAHRISHRLFVGPIPRSLCVLHRCDNRACVNPLHLFLGSQKDNVRDMHRKGRQSNIRAVGSAAGAAKLTEDKVAELRKLAATTSQADLAEKYGVSVVMVSKIIRRLNWRHVP